MTSLFRGNAFPRARRPSGLVSPFSGTSPRTPLAIGCLGGGFAPLPPVGFGRTRPAVASRDFFQSLELPRAKGGRVAGPFGNPASRDAALPAPWQLGRRGAMAALLGMVARDDRFCPPEAAMRRLRGCPGGRACRDLRGALGPCKMEAVSEIACRFSDIQERDSILGVATPPAHHPVCPRVESNMTRCHAVARLSSSGSWKVLTTPEVVR